MNKDYEKMNVATLEQFIEANNGKGPWYGDRRIETLKEFPFSVIVEACYPVGDFAVRWCWQNFGPMDCKECGEHYSEYPGCPQVLAIEEYTIPKSYTDKDGVVHNYNFHTRDPGKHGHEGNWTVVWLGKTGYDYGFGEYFFKNEADKDKFLTNVSSFGLGENYD
jgi:hypothetical protein